MKTNIILWLIAISASWVFLTGASSVEEKVELRLRIMDKTVEEAKSFRGRVQSLAPTAAKFESTFPDKSQIADIFDLYQLLGVDKLGLIAKPEGTSVTRINDIERKSRIVGAVDLCLTSQGGGFTVEAPNLDQLTRGLEDLLGRPWVNAKGVTISMVPGRGRALASLSDFCLVLRDEELLTKMRGEA